MSTTHSILIIDDEPELRDVLVDMLENYQVLVAANGVEGLSIIKHKQPTVVISDVYMPKMTGMELLAELKTQNIQTPVILMTGFSDTKSIAEARRLGAFDFLDKPLDSTQLLSLVKKAVTFGKPPAPSLSATAPLKTTRAATHTPPASVQAPAKSSTVHTPAPLATPSVASLPLRTSSHTLSPEVWEALDRAAASEHFTVEGWIRARLAAAGFLKKAG